jgi:hypothetical protein
MDEGINKAAIEKKQDLHQVIETMCVTERYNRRTVTNCFRAIKKQIKEEFYETRN